MAGPTLYAPIMTKDTMICFGAKSLKIYFDYSKYMSEETIQNIQEIHVSITKQNSGVSVINKERNPLGIYIGKISKDNLNKTYIEINQKEIIGEKFEIGEIYKAQIRFSLVKTSLDDSLWFTERNGQYSEWSTYSIIKFTTIPIISVPMFKYSSDEDKPTLADTIYSIYKNDITFEVEYSNVDEKEELYSYELILFEETSAGDKNIIENSGTLYNIEQLGGGKAKFEYAFDTILETGKNYFIKLIYCTINGYSDNIVFKTIIVDSASLQANIELKFRDKYPGLETSLCNSIEQENELGLVEYKIGRKPGHIIPYQKGYIYIKRASSKDNFKKWYTIKTIAFNEVGEENISFDNLGSFYDNTIESGVYYQYGAQVFDGFNEQKTTIEIAMDTNTNPLLIRRDFEFSHLVGEEGKQLILKFNNNQNSLQYNISDSKTDTIGGKYPFITRNGNRKYRSFAISGLISFQMDEEHLFINNEILYGVKAKKYDTLTNSMVTQIDNQRVINAYVEDQKKNYIYNYKHEMDFRDAVAEFLQDGKIKLYKSPTEGNILVRLMDVSFAAEQGLNRMLYSFSATAIEMDEDNYKNYIKYNILKINTEPFDTYKCELKLGQLILCTNNHTPSEIDIIKEIYNKYNQNYDKTLASDDENETSNKTYYSYRIKKITGMSISFEGDNYKFKYNGDNILGHGFNYNGSDYYVFNKYVFDDDIEFNDSDSIIIKNPCDADDYTDVKVVVDFLYVLETTDANVGKKLYASADRTLGQFRGHIKKDFNIFDELFDRYYWDNNEIYQQLTCLLGIKIQAAPGTKFYILDSLDEDSTPIGELTHVINETGEFQIKNIKIYGLSLLSDETDVIIDYLADVQKGRIQRR